MSTDIKVLVDKVMSIVNKFESDFISTINESDSEEDRMRLELELEPFNFQTDSANRNEHCHICKKLIPYGKECLHSDEFYEGTIRGDEEIILCGYECLEKAKAKLEKRLKKKVFIVISRQESDCELSDYNL